jgi:hypothetical protein
MKDDLPSLRSLLPDRRSTSPALTLLDESVGQQVNSVSQSPAMKVTGLPGIGVLRRITLFQFV